MKATIESEIEDVLTLEPDLPALDVAHRIVQRRTHDERDYWLQMLIAQKVETRLRGQARAVERLAMPIGRKVYPGEDATGKGVRVVTDWSPVDRLIREFESQIEARVRGEFTAEFMATAFDVGDGHSTTWGDATLAEHEVRLAMLRGQVGGNAETAARHMFAIKVIRSGNGNTLAEVSP